MIKNCKIYNYNQLLGTQKTNFLTKNSSRVHHFRFIDQLRLACQANLSLQYNMMSEQEEQKQREQQLLKSIFQSSFACYFCKFTQDVLRCDILYDETPCKRHICVRCYAKNKNQPCDGHNYDDHYFHQKKIKLAGRTGIVEQATKMFQREQKIRSNPEYINLDLELINLMAYLHMNPASPELRVTYNNVDNAVKQTLGDKKREERKLHTQIAKTKKANYVNRIDHRHLQFGIETCGYNRTHDKGITLVLRAFANHPQTKANEAQKPEKEYFPYLNLEQHQNQLEANNQ